MAEDDKFDLTTLPSKGLTPKKRERRMYKLAMDLEEERLATGKASSAEIIYWLKRMSKREKLELENLRLQGELLKAKAEAVKAEQRSNTAYAEAMRAFSGYLPTKSDDIEDAEFRELK